MNCPRIARYTNNQISEVALRLIIGIDILLLTLAIGLNLERARTSYGSILPQCEECGE